MLTKTKEKIKLRVRRENLPSNGFCSPDGPERENKRKQKDREKLESCSRTKITAEHGSDTNNSWYTWNDPQRLGKKLEEQEISRRTETIRSQHCYDRVEYWEESWRPEETWCCLDSSENLKKRKLDRTWLSLNNMVIL